MAATFMTDDSGFGKAEVFFMKPKDEASWLKYVEEAKGMLDKASKNTNPMGIPILLGALCFLVSKEYYGKENPKGSKAIEEFI